MTRLMLDTHSQLLRATTQFELADDYRVDIDSRLTVVWLLTYWLHVQASTN